MPQLKQEMKNRHLTLYLQGELDHHRSQEIMNEIHRSIDESLPKELRLDLSGLLFSDSSGIAVLLRSKRAMSQLQGSLEVVQIPPQPYRLFQIAGLEKILALSPLVSETATP